MPRSKKHRTRRGTYRTSGSVPEDILHGSLPIKHSQWVQEQTDKFLAHGKDIASATRELWRAAKAHKRDGHPEALGETTGVLVSVFSGPYGQTRTLTDKEVREVYPKLRQAVHDYLTNLARERGTFIGVASGPDEARAVRSSVEQAKRLRDALVPNIMERESEAKSHCEWVGRPGSKAEEDRRLLELVRTLYKGLEWRRVLEKYDISPHMAVEDQARALLSPNTQELEMQVRRFAGTPDLKQALREVRKLPGGSNVLRRRSRAKEGAPMYIGVVAGSPPGSFPVWHDRRHVMAALDYAHNAKDPERLRTALKILFKKC